MTGLWPGRHRPAGFGLDAFPDIVMNEGPAGHVVDAGRFAFKNPEDRIPARMDQALMV